MLPISPKTANLGFYQLFWLSQSMSWWERYSSFHTRDGIALVGPDKDSDQELTDYNVPRWFADSALFYKCTLIRQVVATYCSHKDGKHYGNDAVS